MKIAVITDQHFGVRKGSKIFTDFQEKFYREVFFPKIDEAGVKLVIECGDTFDLRKSIDFYSLTRAKRMWYDPLAKRSLPTYSIVGNHNIYYKSSNEINSNALLSSGYKNIKPVESPLVIDMIDATLIPWINKYNHDECMKHLDDPQTSKVFGHFEFNGVPMNSYEMSSHGLPISAARKVEALYSGHFHKQSTTKNVHYLGAPYEMNWHDYADDRGFHIWDTETDEMEFIKNPFVMFYVLNYDDSVDPLEHDFSEYEDRYLKMIVNSKQDAANFDLFISELEKACPADIQVIDRYLNSSERVSLSEEDVDGKDTEEIIKEVIDKSYTEGEISVSKEDLTKFMKEVYHQALNREEVIR